MVLSDTMPTGRCPYISSYWSGNVDGLAHCVSLQAQWDCSKINGKMQKNYVETFIKPLTLHNYYERRTRQQIYQSTLSKMQKRTDPLRKGFYPSEMSCL